MTTTITPATAPNGRGADRSDRSVRPVAPVRQRNLTRVAIGAVVIAVSTLGVVSLTTNPAPRQTAFAVAQTVAAGQPIHRDDLRIVDLPARTNLRTIPASGAGRIVGRTAAVTLMAGSLLSPDQIRSVDTSARTALVGAILKPGQYPSTLAVGDRVLIVTTPDTSTGTSVDATASTTDTARGLVVTVTPEPSGTGSTSVSLRVSIGDAPAVAAAGGTGHVDLVSVGP